MRLGRPLSTQSSQCKVQNSGPEAGAASIFSFAFALVVTFRVKLYLQSTRHVSVEQTAKLCPKTHHV